MRRPAWGPTVQVGLVAFGISALAQGVAQRLDIVHAFWDAQAHLDIARRLHDATTPGLQMLGTVWLPIPHLLLFPFTLVDAWWWSGLAGGLVGMLATTGLAIALHDLVARRTGRQGWGWFAALLAILTPSYLYLQTTAMTEPVLLAFLTGAVALLDRWLADRAQGRALLGAGILTALAVGSRYDGWFFAACAGLTVLAVARDLRPALRFAWPVAVMALAWLAYNAAYFGDPLEFQRGVWSAQAQQQALAAQGLLPDRGNLPGAVASYLGAAGLTLGWVTLGVGMLAILFVAMHRLSGTAAVLLMASALPFNLLALVLGQSVISLPWDEPPGVANLRYGVMLLPAVVTALALAGAALAERWGRRGTLLAMAVVVAVQAGLTVAGGVPAIGALREGLAIRDGDPAQMRASRWLATHWDRGRILVAPAVNISPRTRIPLKDRVYPWTWQLGEAALANPAEAVDWVVVDWRATSDPVAQAMADRPAFRQRFARVFADRELEIWRRR
ncbi:MAG TPA: hypothetical protein VFN90_03590 [Gemmatimonadales bacterium]|nr:hypothetical protein [Gemmatimonadales bacterium]